MRNAKINRKLAQELKHDRGYRRMLHEGAKAVASQASALTERAEEPWMRRQAKTIVLHEDGEGVFVINTDWAGHLVEWGSKNNPAHAPLRRGARAAGLRFKAE